MSGNVKARNLYIKLGAKHLKNYIGFETQCEKLYWEL